MSRGRRMSKNHKNRRRPDGRGIQMAPGYLRLRIMTQPNVRATCTTRNGTSQAVRCCDAITDNGGHSVSARHDRPGSQPTATNHVSKTKSFGWDAVTCWRTAGWGALRILCRTKEVRHGARTPKHEHATEHPNYRRARRCLHRLVGLCGETEGDEP